VRPAADRGVYDYPSSKSQVFPLTRVGFSPRPRYIAQGIAPTGLARTTPSRVIDRLEGA
jgi:hypothetical protein